MRFGRCLDGYFGEFCENKARPCQSLPCKNNGKCVASGFNYRSVLAACVYLPAVFKLNCLF